MFIIRLSSFFGHFSHRSEWQLIKIDYKSIFSRKCTEEDYQTWHLHNQVKATHHRGRNMLKTIKDTSHS